MEAMLCETPWSSCLGKRKHDGCWGGGVDAPERPEARRRRRRLGDEGAGSPGSLCPSAAPCASSLGGAASCRGAAFLVEPLPLLAVLLGAGGGVRLALYISAWAPAGLAMLTQTAIIGGIIGAAVTACMSLRSAACDCEFLFDYCDCECDCAT
mmetsp:Transcript_80684/g.172574  ORF Transcript_80684/g.172574 Transcript_80684/m.172574 type:complete len:153 (+) Transcript_80684:95-553(+)